ncbi:MAG: hypothetical protein RL367_2370 [Pseudomonadota bacterium]
MTIPVTAFTAAVCALLLLLTAIDTVRHRIRSKTAFGDGGDARLVSASRAHANLAEHAPLVLIMMAALELAHANHKLLLGIGAAFLVARVAHIIGLYQPVSEKPPLPRSMGVMLTWAVIAVLGVWSALMLVNTNLGH